MQNLWGVCAPRASLHQKLLGYLCTWSLSFTCKIFGVSLYPESLERIQTQNFWGIIAHLECSDGENVWGPGPLGHLPPKSPGVSPTQQP